jgi:hypothetical protein
MAQNDVLDLGAAKSDLNPTFHNLPGDGPKLTLGQSAHTGLSLGPQMNTQDFLQKAVNDASAPPAASPAGTAKRAEAPAQTDATAASPADPEAARNKLAQEALLADPAQMRKVFPVVLQDMGLKENAYLDMSAIDLGLHNSKLSQSDKNFLTVLKAGYKEFSQTPTEMSKLQDDGSGVSAKSLTILDKAINRDIADDPIQKNDQEWGWIKAGSVGLSLGSLGAKMISDKRLAMVAMGASAIGGALLWECMVSGKGSEVEAESYDTEKNHYLAFVKDFETMKVAK